MKKLISILIFFSLSSYSDAVQVVNTVLKKDLSYEQFTTINDEKKISTGVIKKSDGETIIEVISPYKEKYVINKDKIIVYDFEFNNTSEIEILKTDNKETNKNKISFIKSKIQEIGFENTAIQYSASSSSTNKGNIGWITSKTLSKEIFNIISKLKIGEVSDIIKRQNSYLILKLNDKKTSVIKNIDMLTLKANLINAKKNEMFELYSRSHLSKLKNNILIEYKWMIK